MTIFLIIISFLLGFIFKSHFYSGKQKFPDLSANGQIFNIIDTYTKQNLLFHGSANKNIKIFQPRDAKTSKRFPDGPVVFATSNIVFASCFMVFLDDSWCKVRSFDLGPYVFICKDKKRFLNDDHGGAIYLLPSDSFYTRFYGWRITEWICKKV